MRITRQAAAVLIIGLITCIGTPTMGKPTRAVHDMVGVEIYSALNFVEEEGEYYGLQVILLPYRDGRKVVWRSAGGYLVEPLLLDLEETGGRLKVVVPSGHDDEGQWTLTIVGNRLRADGPRMLHFDLIRLR